MNRFLLYLNQLQSLSVAAKMLLSFLLIYSPRISHHYLFLFTAFILLYAIVEKRFLERPLFWVLTCVFYTIGIYNNFYNTGNHTFVALYLGILMLIASISIPDSTKILYKNARFLLGIIMLFAVIQKWLSEAFMNGSSLLYINARGGFFKHFQRFFPENQTILQANKEKVLEQMSSYENMLTPIQIESPNWIVSYNPELFAYIILVVEVLFFLFLFVKSQWLRNGFFIAFMLGLLVTREETGFAGLLCIMLFLQSSYDKPIFRFAYIALFALCMSLIISKLGFF